MRKFGLILAMVFALAPLPVFGAQAVEIPYARAVQMAIDDMQALQELGVIIRDMETQHRDFRYQFTRLQRGELRQDAITALNEQMADVNTMMFVTMQNQSLLNDQVNLSLQAISVGTGADGVESNLDQMLQAAVAGTMAAQGMGSQIEEMSRMHTHLFGELHELNDDRTFRDMVDDVRRDVYALERTIEGLRISQETTQIAMEQAVRNILALMADLDIGIEALEANIVLMQENLRRTTISFEVGIISSHTLRAVEHGLAQGNAQLAELRRSQDALRRNLNHLLGLPLAQNTVVSHRRDLPSIPQNLDQHIYQLVSDAPSIRQRTLDIDEARANRRAYTGNDRDIRITDTERRRAQNTLTNRDRNAQDIRNDEEILRARNRVNLQDSVDRAITNRDQAKRQMDAALRRAYAELEALFDQVEGKERDMAQAKSALSAARANFTAGRITRFDVQQAELAVTGVERDIERIYNQQWLLAFQLENPSLLLER